MASTSPSPDSSLASFPPPSPSNDTLTTTSPPPPSPSNDTLNTMPPPPPSDDSSITTPPPSATQLNQTSETPPPTSPSTSAPPPPSTPSAVPGTPSPSPPQSPPPPDASPPPPPALPASPPPSPPAPIVSTPPLSPPINDTPPASSPPPPIFSPPPPSGGSPPQPTPDPPAPPAVTLSPPPLPPATAVSPSPPPPQDVPSPPPSDSPPPTRPHPPPPKSSPPSPQQTPPPLSSTPPTSNSSHSHPVSPSSSPPMLPPTNSSNTGNTISAQLSPDPTTARSTNGTDDVTSRRSSGGLKTGGAVAIGLFVAFVTLSFLVTVLWYRRRQKKRRGPNVGHMIPSPFASSQNSDSFFLKTQQSAHPLSGSPSGSNFMYSPEQGGVGNSRAWFTYEELAEATDGFSGSNLLGEGGFGCVYKGFLVDGREVAVKQLKVGGGQGEREFRAEVEIISRVHHRHLVSLVGYCISERQRLLVYQYVPNNTLYYHLHGEGRPVMDWATRIRVAAGAARGIAYLHEDCHPRIIHRDIKSSNILLDNNFDAQVADFGLAKLAMDANTHVTTRVMGTFGYMAPEYASSGKLTEKSDVFSFGVVLLELITGRKPVDASQPLGDESLVEWARPLLNQALDKQEFEELVDPRLEKNYVQVEMFRMIEAAAVCIRHLAPKRPRMSQVVRALDSVVEFTMDLSNGMKPGQSQIFDSREQSAQIKLFQRMAFGSQDYSSEYFNDSHSGWRSSKYTTDILQ